MDQFVKYKLFTRIMAFLLIFLIGGCGSIPDSEKLAVKQEITESKHTNTQTNTKESGEYVPKGPELNFLEIFFLKSLLLKSQVTEEKLQPQRIII